MQHRQLGPFQVSAIGLGCMNLSHAYGTPPSREQGERVLLAALDAGVTLFDTAALYGFGANEKLLGPVLKAHRQRFTLAHELGHAVMHPVPSSDMESQADRFAAALLMPARDVAPQLSGGITLPRLAALKPVWRVSMAALLMRAKTLGVLSESQSSYLWRQFSRFGYRTAEPQDVAVAAESPHVVADVLNVHLTELGYSLSELAASLHVYEPDLLLMHHLRSPSARPALRVVR